MNFIFKNILLSALLILFLLPSLSYAERNSSEEIFFVGIQAGINTVQGFYRDEIGNGYNAGIFAGYKLFSNFLIDGDFSYNKFRLKESSSSDFSLISTGLGASYIYPFKYITPYTGILLNINYIELNAVMTERTERTLKPGIMIKAGIYSQFGKIMMNAGIKYSVNELSRKFFQNTMINLGISYVFNFIPQEKYQDISQEMETTSKKIETVSRQLQIDDVYENGKSCFNNGDGLKAREYFDKVISMDRNYKDTEQYVLIINSSEDKYRQSLIYISEKKVFDALPLLIDTEKYLLEARDELNKLRSQLKKTEKELEVQGIKAYNDEDYGKCISIMKKIQLINPDNETVAIYLPRAEMRNEALKKFQ